MRTVNQILDEIMTLVAEAQSLTAQPTYEVDENWIVQEAKALEEDRSVRETAMKTET